MADLPLEGRQKQTDEKKEVPLTVEERLDRAEKDIQEIARGVNTQGALLEGMVHAFSSIVKTYVSLTSPKASDRDKKDA